ncbi:GntP family permease [Stenotrophomonas oahuensis]|uniref:SLC13 family permease n=1 Tax=Stenotrophomonas oahuensis TaxID=3003271 RepID=A0ABY9YNB4_9GAMM|nr:SLC13 family permease [Stenotrophomonas sp. A5586]WNH52222.1 SLC13 family permease [Stenotrophomonas sp. A5586]
MHEWFVLANAMFAILLIVLLIIYFKVNPMIALVAGPLYLGLSSGLGFAETIKAINEGFGELMGKIGLLIGFGVMIGAFLHRMGAFQQVVRLLVRTFKPRQMPYAFATILTAIFPPIYTDVLLLMSAPLARATARRMGGDALPKMAAAVGVGIYMALTMVVPGVAALALSAVLDVELGTMLLVGLAIAIPTVFLTLWGFHWLLHRGFWKPETDELPEDEQPAVIAADEATEGNAVPLKLSLLPIIVPMLMIALGAVDRVMGWDAPVLEAIGNSTFALFCGLALAFFIARFTIPAKDRSGAVTDAFKESGQILLLTGVAGSLSAVVATTGMGDILSGYFTANTAAPLLLVWLVAAILHIAIGSVSASAITAASLLAPALHSLDVPPVLVALAAGSGSLFLVHVTSNTFWLMQTTMGMTLRGTLKTLSLPLSMASVVSLVLILIASAIF